MQRRSFLIMTACTAGFSFLRQTKPPYLHNNKTIMTVNGALSPNLLGVTLPHEHVLVDFEEVRAENSPRYDRDEVFRTVRPFLTALKNAGCRSLIECTPDYLGRDPVLLRDLSSATGLNLLTNTGYYGALQDECLPEHAFSETADQLASRWTHEWTNGIGDTGIRPGFIKIGVDSGQLSEIDRKLVQAAARTHLRTGLTIAAHTGPATGAFDQITVLEQEGVNPAAWIWVHAQGERELDRHLEAAEKGAWVSFDGLSKENVDDYVRMVTNMKQNGLLHRVLVSHDAGWYHVGEPGGGQFRPFDTLFNEFIPALTDSGFSNQEIRHLIVLNPADAYTIRVRSL